MIINIIISHYNNIKIKYEKQSGNFAGSLKRFTSIIFSIINQIVFFTLVLFFLFDIVIKTEKKTHAGHAAFEKNDVFRSFFQIFFRQDGWHCSRSFLEDASYEVGDAPSKKIAQSRL